MKKTYAVLFLSLVIITLLWTLLENQGYVQTPYLQKQLRKTTTKEQTAATYIMRVSTNNTPLKYTPRKDYLTEEEALGFKPLNDVMNVVSMKQSKIDLKGVMINDRIQHELQLFNVRKRSTSRPNRFVLTEESKTRVSSVGGTFKISITLMEMNGHRRTRGGDKIHVRIMNTSKNAFAPGFVIDHDNGAYTAVVPALWPGQSIISVQLAYPREIIRAFYATKQERYTVRAVMGRYESGKQIEEVQCQPSREYFKPDQDICNQTLTNGGMSWYCEKPKNNLLKCEDWTSVKNSVLGDIIMNDAEKKFVTSTSLWEPNFSRYTGSIKDDIRFEIGDIRTIKVIVNGTLKNNDELPNCSSIPRRETWIQHEPSGYFLNDQWQPTFCNLPRDRSYGYCLRGQRIVIFGDSTSREWYKYMMKYLSCRQITEKWTDKSWHKRAFCISSTMNFTAEWLPHGQPFYVGPGWKARKDTTQPISTYLNEMSGNAKLVIVIHMFVHLSNYRICIFRDRMKAISRSAKHLLMKNKNIVILVKGPHTFNQIRSYVYYESRAIIKYEFRELQDKVIFMEQGDMTIAKDNTDMHPALDIHKEAVRQFIGYIC